MTLFLIGLLSLLFAVTGAAAGAQFTVNYRWEWATSAVVLVLASATLAMAIIGER